MTTMTPLPLEESSGLQSTIGYYRMKAGLEHLKDSLDDAERTATAPGDLEDGDPRSEEVCEYLGLLFRELTQCADSDPLRPTMNDLEDQLATATHVLAHVLQAAADEQDRTPIGRERVKAWYEETKQTKAEREATKLTET
jgi:hypothetical protein